MESKSRHGRSRYSQLLIGTPLREGMTLLLCSLIVTGLSTCGGNQDASDGAGGDGAGGDGEARAWDGGSDEDHAGDGPSTNVPGEGADATSARFKLLVIAFHHGFFRDAAQPDVSGGNINLKPIMQPLEEFKDRALFLHGLDGHFVVAGGLCDEGRFTYYGMWTTVGKRFPSTVVAPEKDCMFDLPSTQPDSTVLSIDEYINARMQTPLRQFNVSGGGNLFPRPYHPEVAHTRLAEAYKANPALPYAELLARWRHTNPPLEGSLQLATVALGSDLVDATGVETYEPGDSQVWHTALSSEEAAASIQTAQSEMSASIAKTMRLMKGMVYGKGNLLDYTMIVWLSGLHAFVNESVRVGGISRWLGHSRSDLSVVVFVPPMLAIKTPRQMRPPPRALGLPLHPRAIPQENRPIVDLWVTLLQAMNIGGSDFGDPSMKPSVIKELLSP
jgi:hypothetical protein